MLYGHFGVQSLDNSAPNISTLVPKGPDSFGPKTVWGGKCRILAGAKNTESSLSFYVHVTVAVLFFSKLNFYTG